MKDEGFAIFDLRFAQSALGNLQSAVGGRPSAVIFSRRRTWNCVV